MRDAIGRLVESPAWRLMDERHKRMAAEIERLTQDPDVALDERSWQNWMAWLDVTLLAIPVRDELDLAPLCSVVQQGYLKAKFETSPEVRRAAAVPVTELIEIRPDELRRLRRSS